MERVILPKSTLSQVDETEFYRETTVETAREKHLRTNAAAMEWKNTRTCNYTGNIFLGKVLKKILQCLRNKIIIANLSMKSEQKRCGHTL